MENSNVEEDNNDYFLRKIIKAIMVISSYVWGYNENNLCYILPHFNVRL